MKKNKRIYKGLILDLDGVLWIENAPMSGAISFLKTLHKNYFPYCILTNDCSVSKTKRLKALVEAGFRLNSEKFITAPEITMNWLGNNGIKSIMYLGGLDVLDDIKSNIIISDNSSIDAVVVGDLFEHYSRDILNKAAKAIINGAKFVALQKNAKWSDGADWYIDNGFWVSGLEFVTGKKALIVGKPHHTAYHSAIEKIGKKIDNYSKILFISDDIKSDLKGAKNIGLTTIYFGQETKLPYWIDYSIQNFHSLLKLLPINKNE